MIDYESQRQKYYSQRIGKVYGCWKVLDVWKDDSNYGQRWKIQCVYCGKVKEVSNGNDLVKGRGVVCKCQRPKKIKPKVVAPTYEDVMNTFKQLINKSNAIGGSSSADDSKNA